MSAWFARLVRTELRSFASVTFFLVLAMSIGSAASWFEGGSARYMAAHTVHAAEVDQSGAVSQEATSTTEAYLPASPEMSRRGGPPGVSTSTAP